MEQASLHRVAIAWVGPGLTECEQTDSWWRCNVTYTLYTYDDRDEDITGLEGGVVLGYEFTL
jgi:hypothetical protein